jgi:histidinol-phosphate aminotransferase
VRYGSNMEFPLKAVLEALRRRPRVLFIANPNNPTGTLVPRADIRKILSASSQTAVVIDEAYAEFSGVSVVPWVNKYPQLFVTRTFSKTAGLAGLRLGAVTAQADSLAVLRRAMPPFPVNVAALVAAEAAVNDASSMRRYVSEVIQVRAWLAEELKKLGAVVYPSAGNFLLVNFGATGPAMCAWLERHGILVRARSREVGVGFVRVSIGTKNEMKRFLSKIKMYRSQNDA